MTPESFPDVLGKVKSLGSFDGSESGHVSYRAEWREWYELRYRDEARARLIPELLRFDFTRLALAQLNARVLFIPNPRI